MRSQQNSGSSKQISGCLNKLEAKIPTSQEGWNEQVCTTKLWDGSGIGSAGCWVLQMRGYRVEVKAGGKMVFVRSRLPSCSSPPSAHQSDRDLPCPYNGRRLDRLNHLDSDYGDSWSNLEQGQRSLLKNSSENIHPELASLEPPVFRSGSLTLVP